MIPIRRVLVSWPALVGLVAGPVLICHGYVSHSAAVVVRKVVQETSGAEGEPREERGKARAEQPAAAKPASRIGEPRPSEPARSPEPGFPEPEPPAGFEPPPGFEQEPPEPFPGPAPPAEGGEAPDQRPAPPAAPPREAPLVEPPGPKQEPPPPEEIVELTEWDLVQEAAQGGITREPDGRLVRIVQVVRSVSDGRTVEAVKAAARCPT